MNLAQALPRVLRLAHYGSAMLSDEDEVNSEDDMAIVVVEEFIKNHSEKEETS